MGSPSVGLIVPLVTVPMMVVFGTGDVVAVSGDAPVDESESDERLLDALLFRPFERITAHELRIEFHRET